MVFPTSFGSASHVGNVRKINEDNLAAAPEHDLWVVADGMGGHEKGELASAIAVKAVVGGVARGLGLEEAVRNAHEEVLAAKDARPGMGSTVVALHFSDRQYTVVWVGDSRAYLWDGRLWPLTRDHSLVQQLMDSGAISAQEAESHPQRSVITQAVGVAGKGGVKPGVRRGQLYRGEQFLLCSDGLIGEVDEQQITAILSDAGDAQYRVDRLIAAALNAGGSDNITVILVGAPQSAPERPRTTQMPAAPGDPDTLEIPALAPHRRSRYIYWVAGSALLLGIGLFLYWSGWLVALPEEPPPGGSPGTEMQQPADTEPASAGG